MIVLPSALRTTRAALVAAGAATVSLLVVAGQLSGAGQGSTDEVALTAPVAVSFTAMGALALIKAPRHAVGRLMFAAGVAASVALLGESWTQWLPLAWLSQWSWWPPYALIILALLVFPNGRLPSPRWRLVAWCVAAAALIATVALAIAAIDHPRSLLTEVGTGFTDRATLMLRIGLVGFLVAAAGGLVGVLWSLVLRWRHADGDTRHQLMCLLPAVGLFLIGLGLSAVGLPGAWALTAVAVPVAMTVAVLRYHLYDLDQVINRSVVWMVMSLLVVVGFVSIVTLLQDILVGSSGSRASLAATGLIAVTFEPLRRVVQRSVNRLLYGDRDDPYQVIARLGDLLGRTAEPHAVLPSLTSAVARSLQVPYVAVELTSREGTRVLAEHGNVPEAVEAFDMVAHGDQIGRLLVATRSPGSRFTGREKRLLADVALHAAVAAEATQLIRDLQDSRERLVMAREEERRRLRRELHDGLGPSLAGMSMQVRAAHKLLPGRTRINEILDALANDLQSCAAEVRQLVDQLRPPTLDHGLEAALRAQCERFDGPALSVRLQIKGDIEGLPAATEVAVFRIVAEALANAARHSQARECRVTVYRAKLLAVDIIDDGVGLATAAERLTGKGVGLNSMRERAAELGGECTFTPVTPHGTAIAVRLPIASVSP